MWFWNLIGWILGILIVGPIVIYLIVMAGIWVYTIFKFIMIDPIKKLVNKRNKKSE